MRMKKWISFMLILACMMGLCACATSDLELLQTQPETAVQAGEIEYEAAVSYVSGPEESEVLVGGLNLDKMYESKTLHLPIFKCDTLQELEAFRKTLEGQWTMDRGYDEVPSFDEVIKAYDEAFFEKNTLLMVYVRAESGSYRYGVNSVYAYGKTLCVHVEQMNHPEEVTDDMAGWFIIVAVSDESIAECTEFDADLTGFP